MSLRFITVIRSLRGEIQDTRPATSHEGDLTGYAITA
jgi:hypothetical protein